MTIDEFLDGNQANLRTPSTRAVYRARLSRLQRLVGDLDTLGPTTLAAWFAASTLSPSTLKALASTVRSYYRWTVRTGSRTVDVSACLDEMRFDGRQVTEHHWLPPHKIAEVIDACPDDLHGHRDRMLLKLGFLTGLRVSEICAVRWSDWDPTACSIRTLGKGQKWALVGVPEGLAVGLGEWHGELVEHGPVPSWVIPALSNRQGVHDRPITTDRVRSIVRAAGDRVGVERLSPHDMRRSLAGVLDGRRVPMEDIQKVLRHTSVATTEGYLRRNPFRAVEVMRPFVL